MLKSIGSNWLRLFAGVAVVFVLTPFLLEHLGPHGNDCWTIVNSTVGLLGLLQLGVPMASVKFFSEHVAKKDVAGLNRAIAGVLGMYLVLGAAAFVVGGGTFVFYEATQKIDPAWVEDGRTAFALMLVWVAAGFVSQLPYGVMFAHHDFGLANVITIAGLALRLGLTVVLLPPRASLPLLAGIQIAVLAFEFVAGLWLVRRRYPGVRIGLAGLERAMVRRILGFSVFVLVLNIGHKLSFSMQSLVIGAHLTDGAVSAYSYPNQLTQYLVDILLGIGQVVMPMAVRLQTQGKEAELREIFFRWSRISVSLTLLAGVYCLVFGPKFLAWWIGPEKLGPEPMAAAGRVLQILTPSFFLFLPARAVALPILMGLGKASGPAFAFLAMGVVNVGLSLALVGGYGLDGVAWATAVPNVLFAAAIARMTCHETGTPLAGWTAYVFVKPLLGAVPVLAALVAIDRYAAVQGFVGLFLAGLAACVAFAVVWILFVHRNDPYVDLHGRLAGLAARVRRRPQKDSA